MSVHKIYLESGNFSIRLHAHTAGLIEIDITNSGKNAFAGTLGSLISTIRSESTFRDMLALSPSREHIAEELRKNNKVLRGLLRETQFYSHNPDLDRRIEETLNNTKKEETT